MHWFWFCIFVFFQKEIIPILEIRIFICSSPGFNPSQYWLVDCNLWVKFSEWNVKMYFQVVVQTLLHPRGVSLCICTRANYHLLIPGYQGATVSTRGSETDRWNGKLSGVRKYQWILTALLCFDYIVRTRWIGSFPVHLTWVGDFSNPFNLSLAGAHSNDHWLECCDF